MNKKTKQLLALVALVLVLVVVFIAIYSSKLKEVKQQAISQAADLVVTSIDSSNKLTFKNPSTELNFEYTDGKWNSLERPDWPVDQTLVQKILDTTEKLYATRVIKEHAGLDSFNLSDPLYRVDMTDAQGHTISLSLSEMNGVYYASTNLNENVYVVDNTPMSVLAYDIYDFIKADNVPRMTSKTFTEIAIEVDGHSYSIKKSQELYDGESEVAKNQKVDAYDSGDMLVTWNRYVDGEEVKPVDSDSVYTIFSDVGYMTFNGCMSYEASDEERAEYGITEPWAMLSITFTDDDGNEQTCVSRVGVAIDEEYCLELNECRQIALVSAERVNEAIGIISAGEAQGIITVESTDEQ